jgi:AbrB family looped-hinge helix DNA binding protein
MAEFKRGVQMGGTSVRITEGGRLVIPVEYRRALGIEVGDEVILQLEEGELWIMTRAEAIKRAQEIVARRVGRGRSLRAELSAERRAEAARE